MNCSLANFDFFPSLSFLPAKHGAFWQASKRGMIGVIRLMVEKCNHEEIMKGTPSPLIVSCWDNETNVTEHLLKSLPPSNIWEPGPDGLTPLMILLKINKIAFIEDNFDQFDNNEMIRLSICFGQPQLLKRAIERDSGQLGWLQLIKQAIAANKKECLRILKTFVGSEMFANIETSSPNPPPSIKMQQEIGLTTQQEQSFLPQMTKAYPDFNKDTKDKFLFGELIESGRVNTKEDILRHHGRLLITRIVMSHVHFFV